MHTGIIGLPGFASPRTARRQGPAEAMALYACVDRTAKKRRTDGICR